MRLLSGAAFCGEITLEELKALQTEPKNIVYKTAGEESLQLHVYAPDGVPGEKRPAIVMIHGGGWSAPGSFHLVPHCRYFALRGLVAVNVEYRLAKKESSVRIPDCVADCRDAVRYVRKNAADLGIDPEKIIVAGESAGGHLAAALGLLPDPEENKAGTVSARPNAMILFNPVVDLTALKWMPQHAGVTALPDSPLEENWEARAKRMSPIFFVRKDLPPTLLIHGAADSVVPVEQADRFAKAMKDAGNKLSYERKDGWEHAFLIPGCGKNEQIAESLHAVTDKFLAELGYLHGDPIITDSKTDLKKP